MVNKVKVIITNDQNTVKVPSGVRLLIRRCCNAVLQMECFDDSAEISVRFVDNEQIKQLNSEYRSIERAFQSHIISIQFFQITKDFKTV